MTFFPVNSLRVGSIVQASPLSLFFVPSRQHTWLICHDGDERCAVLLTDEAFHFNRLDVLEALSTGIEISAISFEVDIDKAVQGGKVENFGALYQKDDKLFLRAKTKEHDEQVDVVVQEGLRFQGSPQRVFFESWRIASEVDGERVVLFERKPEI